MAMAPTDVGAVCRLCTKTKELLWVFNDKIKTSENFKDVIAITTGVEIKMDDGPSQFVCKKCLECAIRMYQFRIRAQQSNKLVIEEYENRLMKPAAPSVPQTSQVKVHSTVTALLKIYPSINVPSSILKRDLSPSVSLPMNFVEDYFRTRNLDMGEAVRAAVKSTRKRPKNPPGSKAVKGKERKEKVEGCDTKSGGPVSPINIKLNSSGPSYQIVKKDLEKKMDPSGITMKNFTESLGLFPTETNTTPPTHEKKKPADILEEKPTKKRRKKKTLFEQTMRILDKVQWSKKRPESSEPPAKKQKIEEPTRKEIEHGDKGQKGEKLTVITKSPEGTLGDVPREKEFENVPLEPIIDKFRPENFDGPIELTIDKQEQCHMCNICNATQFDRRGLKRHMQRHMRCPFCKKRFKSFESTDEHIKQFCPISTSMNNLPDVWLDRVEFDRCSREKYRNAFEGYFPTVEKNESGKVGEKIAAGDVIEILSDDEDAASSKRPEHVIEISDDIPRNNHRANTESCSVIVPRIQLKNPRQHQVSSNDSELDILKALLSKDVSSSSSSQTLMMDDVLNVKEGSHIRMVGLKSQLHVQKIPVTIKGGPFSLKLKKVPTKMDSCHSLMMRWDDFPRCDIANPMGSSALPVAPPAVALEKAGKKIVPVKVAATTATTCIAGLNVFATPFVPVVMTTASSNLLTTQAVVRSISSSIVTTTDSQVASVTPPVATSTPAPDGFASGAGLLVVPPGNWNCDLNGQIEGRPPPLIPLSEASAQDVIVTAGASIPTNASPKSAELLKFDVQAAINRALMPLSKPTFVKPLPPKQSRPKPSPPESPIPTSSYSKPDLTNSLRPKLPHWPYLPKKSGPRMPNPPKSSGPRMPNPPKSSLPKTSLPKTYLANSSVSKPPLPKPSHPKSPLSKASLPKPSPSNPKPSHPNPWLSKPALPKPSHPNPSLSNTSLPNSLVSKPPLPKPSPSNPKPSLPNSLVAKPPLPKPSPSNPNPSLSKTSLPNSSALKPPLSRSSPSNAKPFHPNPSVPKTSLPDPSVPKPSPPNATMPLNSVYGLHDRRAMYKNGVQPPALPYQPPKTTENRQIVLNSLIKMAPVTADNGTQNKAAIMKQPMSQASNQKTSPSALMKLSTNQDSNPKTSSPVGGPAYIRVFRPQRCILTTTNANTSVASLVHNVGSATSSDNLSVAGVIGGSTSGTASSGSTSSGHQMTTVNDATKTQSHTANGVIRVKDVWELK